MTDKIQEKMKEITIVKKKVTMQYEEYFSIGLKSPDESIESLLEKAMTVIKSEDPPKIKNNLELV